MINGSDESSYRIRAWPTRRTDAPFRISLCEVQQQLRIAGTRRGSAAVSDLRQPKTRKTVERSRRPHARFEQSSHLRGARPRRLRHGFMRHGQLPAVVAPRPGCGDRNPRPTGGRVAAQRPGEGGCRIVWGLPLPGSAPTPTSQFSRVVMLGCIRPKSGVPVGADSSQTYNPHCKPFRTGDLFENPSRAVTLFSGWV